MAFPARPIPGTKKAAVSRRRPFKRPSDRSPAAVIPVTAVMVMARAAEAVMAVPMATVTHVAAVVAAIAAVLRLLDHLTGRRGRLGLDRERGSLRSAGRRSEAQAGDRDRQCGDLDHGLSCASQHYRRLHLYLGDGAADRGSSRCPAYQTTRGRRMIPMISRPNPCRVSFAGWARSGLRRSRRGRRGLIGDAQALTIVCQDPACVRFLSP